MINMTAEQIQKDAAFVSYADTRIDAIHAKVGAGAYVMDSEYRVVEALDQVVNNTEKIATDSTLGLELKARLVALYIRIKDKMTVILKSAGERIKNIWASIVKYFNMAVEQTQKYAMQALDYVAPKPAAVPVAAQTMPTPGTCFWYAAYPSVQKSSSTSPGAAENGGYPSPAV